MQNIGIIDIGNGNIGAIVKSIEELGARYHIISNEKNLNKMDKIIIPGVGHYSSAMSHLEKLQLSEPIQYAINVIKKPVLGICLGMQLLGNESEEGNIKGLSIIPGKVIKIEITNKVKYKIPNIGWNKIEIIKKHCIVDEVIEFDEFYFLHSYHFLPEKPNSIISKSLYEDEFNSIIGQDNIVGVQFHPEKSYKSGKKIINNFINKM